MVLTDLPPSSVPCPTQEEEPPIFPCGCQAQHNRVTQLTNESDDETLSFHHHYSSVCKVSPSLRSEKQSSIPQGTILHLQTCKRQRPQTTQPSFHLAENTGHADTLAHKGGVAQAILFHTAHPGGLLAGAPEVFHFQGYFQIPLR